MAGDDDEMFMTRSLNVVPKTTEQYFTARKDKSEADATNNRVCTRRFVSTGRHEASRGLFGDSRAILVCF